MGSKILDEKRRKLLNRLAGAEKPSSADAQMPRVPRVGHIAPSFAQERMWFLDQLDESHSGTYNECICSRLTGPVDAAVLEQALGDLVARHEVLASSFYLQDGEVSAAVATQVTQPLLTVETIAAPAIQRRLEVELCKPFDLARAPLLRALLLRETAERSTLLVTVHHIAADAVALALVKRELADLYAARLAGNTLAKESRSVDYYDYAAWQRKWAEGDVAKKQLTYWKETLVGSEGTQLPSDRPRPTTTADSGALVYHLVPPDLLALLDDVARQHRATRYSVMAAAFLALLHRYTARTDLLVGAVLANRNRVETERMVGLLANSLPLRVQIDPSDSLATVIRNVARSVAAVSDNEDIPFDRIVDAVAPKRALAMHPIFQIMFNLADATGLTIDLAGTTSERVVVHNGTTKFDLSVVIEELPAQLAVQLEYSTALFDGSTIERLARHYFELMRALFRAPTEPIGDVAFLETDTRVELSGGPVPGDSRTVVERFREHAARRPDAPAVRAGERTLTYAELDTASDRVGAALATRVDAGGVVAIQLDRSLDLVIAILGVLKAGCAYLAIDPSYPAEHNGRVLALAKPSLVITEIDSLTSDTQRPVGPAANDFAYVIFTSGSTGQPKGVMVRHESLASYANALSPMLRIGPESGYLHTASFAFSSSVRQLLLPLSAGACVVIASRDLVLQPSELLAEVRRRAVTHLDLVPSYARALLDVVNVQPLPGVQTVAFASEALPWALVDAWRAKLGSTRLVNMYGQTETTGIVLAYEIPATAARGSLLVPIGTPLPGMTARIADARGHAMPFGIDGELVLSGPQVAAGYLGDGAALDAHYRTGDVVRCTVDGIVTYTGRRDDQTKVNGQRVEPAEVEAALSAIADVRECAVLAVGDGLVGFVVGTENADRVRAELARGLPAYMVPARVLAVATMPRTGNGKIDRHALRKAITLDANVEPARALDPDEQRMLGVFAEVLQLPADQIDTMKDFFDLGGHSLLGVRLLAAIERVFSIRLPPTSVFERASVRGLARKVAFEQVNSRR